MRRLFASCLSYLCLAGRKVATRKPTKITIWRVFAWRPFAPPGKDTTNRGENARGRHAKTRQMVTFFVFSHGDLSPRHMKVRDIPCVVFSATVCRIFAWRGERSPCENPTKSPFGGFSRGDLSRFHPCLSYLCLAGRKVATRKHAK